jgi:PII-like signaling protein
MRIQIDENVLRDADATKDSICPKLISQGMDGATVISAIVEGYQSIAPFP